MAGAKTGRAVAAAVILVASAGCGAQSNPPSGAAADGSSSTGRTTAVSHGGIVRDHVSLVDRLRAEGLLVQPARATHRSFLSVPGTALQLAGGGLSDPITVESYNYDSTDLGMDGAAVATQDAQRISARAAASPSTPTDISAETHFFKAGAVLVLYQGSNPRTVQLLTQALGPPFADWPGR